jgi:hypothetical protein
MAFTAIAHAWFRRAAPALDRQFPPPSGIGQKTGTRVYVLHNSRDDAARLGIALLDVRTTWGSAPSATT